MGSVWRRFIKKIDGFYFDFTDFPDIAQAVIATCAGIGIRGRFEGLQSLQIKETDRLRAMKNEIEKLGVQVAASGKGDLITALEIKTNETGISRRTYFRNLWRSSHSHDTGATGDENQFTENTESGCCGQIVSGFLGTHDVTWIYYWIAAI